MQYAGLSMANRIRCAWVCIAIFYLAGILFSAAAEPSTLDTLKTSLESLQSDREALLKRVEAVEQSLGAKAAPARAERQITDADRQFWAYQPLHKNAPPTTQDSAWPRNPIDSYVLSALEAQGLKPSAEASPEKRLLRLYYDVIGLPPSPEEVAEFLRDPSPEAYAKIV